MSEIRTRFAPSPTGYLHVGGARTALFNWLFARKNEGKFILRIEDTDLERSTKEAVQAILDGMEWLGLDWDEGPFYQSERLELYNKYAKQLLDEGKAYEAESKNTEQGSATGTQVRAIHESPQHTKDNSSSSQGKAIFFKSTVENEDDFVIMKSDGMPTYHFAVVIDDWLMNITHVIRGSDHISNTPKHIMLYKALDVKPPKFVHVPMILGSDGQRLSKRHGATSVLAYRDEGYLPEALINYLVRLGWAYKDQEIFSREEMINLFSLSKLGNSAGVFDPQKLSWLNGYYIQQANPEKLLSIIQQDFNCQIENSPRIISIIELLKPRAKVIPDIIESMKYFLMDNISYDMEAVQTHLTSSSFGLLKELEPRLSEVVSWDKPALEEVIRGLAKEKELKAADIIHPLRVAITGKSASPGIFETAELIGKEKVLYRLNNLPV
ncbi:MAG: glutamate--tRNA ligase [Candidatus Margulisiibacteriota bacterium]